MCVWCDSSMFDDCSGDSGNNGKPKKKRLLYYAPNVVCVEPHLERSYHSQFIIDIDLHRNLNSSI